MKIEKVKTSLGRGEYEEALETIRNLSEGQQFEGLSYKILIYCLRGEIQKALPEITQLEQIADSKGNIMTRFIVLTLKTFVKSHQGNEPEVYQNYNESQELLTKLAEHERLELTEWEGWLHYGLALFYQNSELYEKPIMDHLTHALDKIGSLPKKRGIEWVLRNIMQYCAMTNQLDLVEEYRKEISNRLKNTNHAFGQAFSSFMKASNQWFKGDYPSSIEGFTNVLPILEKLKLYTLVVGGYNGKALINLNKGDFEGAINYAEKGIKIMQENGFFWPYPWNVAMGANLKKGETQKALKYAKRRLSLMEKLQNQKGIVKQLRWIAQVYYAKGEYETALTWTKKCLSRAENANNMREQVWAIELIGIIYYQMGKLDQAVKYLQQALVKSKGLRKEFGGKGMTTGYVQANLAELYSMRGEFDKALELMESSVALMEKHESSWYMHDFYLTKGTILIKKGEFLKAKNQLQRSLAVHEKYGGVVSSADTLYHLILVDSELGNIEEAHQHLQQLEQVKDATTDTKIQQQIHLARGLIYKKSPRAVMKAKAQEIFQQVTKEEKIELDLFIFAVFNLLELLIWEVSSSGHEEVLEEISNLILQMNEFAQNQHAPTVEIEVTLIQSQLQLITGNLNQAMEVLKRAWEIAEENNLKNHQKRIERQEHDIEAELHKWQELTERNAPMMERVQESQVLDYIDTALRLVGKGSSQEELIKPSLQTKV